MIQGTTFYLSYHRFFAALISLIFLFLLLYGVRDAEISGGTFQMYFSNDPVSDGNVKSGEQRKSPEQKRLHPKCLDAL